MTEPSPQNKSAVGSPADAGDPSAGRGKLVALQARYREYSLATPFEIVGFWAAIALPFLYMPLLVTGISARGELVTFVGLLALHVAALLLGHGHNRE